MPRNAAVLALSAVLLTGVIAAAPGAVGGEAPTPTPTPTSAPSPNTQTPVPAPLKQVDGDGVVLATVSPLGNLWRPDEATPASGFVLLDKPCEHLPAPGFLLPDTGTDARLATAYGMDPAWPVTQVRNTSRTVVLPGSLRPYCAAVVTADVDKSAPASGTLVLKTVAGPPGPADAAPVVSWVKYSVTRSTSPRTYGLAFIVSAVLGLLLAVWLWFAFGWKKRRNHRTLPETYAYDKPWATAIALLGAIGTPLLAQSGALTAFSPQYDTAGIAVANIGVAVILALGPVLVAAFYERGSEVTAGAAHTDRRPQCRRRWVLSAVGGLVLAGLTAQLLLDGIYIFTAGAGAGWLVLGAVLWLLLIFFIHESLTSDVPE